MYKITIAFLLVCFSACTNSSNTSVPAGDSSASAETPHANAELTGHTGAQPLVVAGCYQMILKRDTAWMQLQLHDTTVTGTLRYDFYEKDKNNGTLNGVLRDDRIYADYQFQSEGMTSVREVIFKIENGTLVQAFGDLAETSGKVVFKDTAALQFQTANPFLKVPCRQ